MRKKNNDENHVSWNIQSLWNFKESSPQFCDSSVLKHRRNLQYKLDLISYSIQCSILPLCVGLHSVSQLIFLVPFPGKWENKNVGKISFSIQLISITFAGAFIFVYWWVLSGGVVFKWDMWMLYKCFRLALNLLRKHSHDYDENYLQHLWFIIQRFS